MENAKRNSAGTTSGAANSEDCIKVAVRVRPLIRSEIDRGCRVILEQPAPKSVCVNNKERYTYNHAFAMDDTQEMVYANAVRPMIQNLFRGLNVTILAYGQTGSGKTHTMGTNFDGNTTDESGLIPRAIADIFEHIEQHSDAYEFEVSCSFVELYQELVYDLLASGSREQNVVDIREDSVRGVFIANLTDIAVTTAGDAVDCLMRGSSGRMVGATAMNATSSRSHAIYTVTVRTTSRTNGNDATNAKFHLVDLAGSERSNKTKATGTRFREGVKINQGLLALGNVISALGSAQRSGQHVTYRDSKLTRLLQDSLGGNSVTLMIACVSPADYNADETLSTLRYADRAKQIRNKPIVNQDPKQAEIIQLRATIDRLRMELLMQCNPEEKSDGPPHKKKFAPVLRSPDGSCTAAAIDGGDGDSFAVASPCRRPFRRLSGIPNAEDQVQLRAENGELRLAAVMLKRKLATALSNLSNVNLLYVTSQEHNEMLTAKLHEIRQQICDLSDGLCAGDEALATERVEVLRSTVDLTVDSHTKFGQQQITRADGDDGDGGIDIDNASDDWSENQEKQMEDNQKLMELQRQIAMKTMVTDRLNENVRALGSVNVDATESEYGCRVAKLEAELAKAREAVDELKRNGGGGKPERTSAKLAEERRRRVLELEAALRVMQKDVDKQRRMQLQRDQYKEQLAKNQRELVEMKRLRVEMTRNMSAVSEKLQREKAERQRDLVKHEAAIRKRTSALQAEKLRLERQQLVMKRKVENSLAANKRLKDAMEKHRTAQSQRKRGGGGATANSEADLVSRIDHEIEIIYSVVDAKHSLDQLCEDRASITQRLIDLRRKAKKNPLSEDEQMLLEQLEEEVEMRNVQIADMQEKIRSSDVDEKVKLLAEGLNSMPESRSAVRHLFNSLTALRVQFDTKATLVMDMRAERDELQDQMRTKELEAEGRIQAIRAECKRMREARLEIERSYEEKVTLLLYEINRRATTTTDGASSAGGDGTADGGAANSVHQRINDELLDAMRAKIEAYEAQVAEMDDKLKRRPVLRGKKAKRNDYGADTFVEYDDESDDSNSTLHTDDSRDPDWHKTPAAKERRRRPMSERMEPNAMQPNAGAGSNLSVTNVANSSRHWCNCKGTCKTKVCGCRKLDLQCGTECGCTRDRCENAAALSTTASSTAVVIDLPTSDADATMATAGDTTVVLHKGNEENFNFSTPPMQLHRTTLPSMDVTTTPYPYENKKRKPLLEF